MCEALGLIPSTAENNDNIQTWGVRLSQIQINTFIDYKDNFLKSGEIAQFVQHVPCMHQAQTLIASTV